MQAARSWRPRSAARPGDQCRHRPVMLVADPTVEAEPPGLVSRPGAKIDALDVAADLHLSAAVRPPSLSRSVSCARCRQRARQFLCEDRRSPVEADADPDAAVEPRRHRLADEDVAGDQRLQHFQREGAVGAAIDGDEIGRRGNRLKSVAAGYRRRSARARRRPAPPPSADSPGRRAPPARRPAPSC